MIFKVYISVHDLFLFFPNFFFFFFFFFEKLVKNRRTEIVYTFQFVLMSCSRHFVIMFCVTASLALLLACFYFFSQNQGFGSYKIVFLKKKKRVYLMLQYLLIEPNIFIRSIFRTQSRIYGRTFFVKIVNN